MMFFKVVKDNKVIDVLDHLKYFKWQSKHKIMVLTDVNDAQVVLSSDGSTFWHTETLYKIPDDAPKFEIVEIKEIPEYEYKQLKALNMKTPEEIIDEFVMSLLEDNIL